MVSDRSLADWMNKMGYIKNGTVATNPTAWKNAFTSYFNDAINQFNQGRTQFTDKRGVAHNMNNVMSYIMSYLQSKNQLKRDSSQGLYYYDNGDNDQNKLLVWNDKNG